MTIYQLFFYALIVASLMKPTTSLFKDYLCKFNVNVRQGSPCMCPALTHTQQPLDIRRICPLSESCPKVASRGSGKQGERSLRKNRLTGIKVQSGGRSLRHLLHSGVAMDNGDAMYILFPFNQIGKRKKKECFYHKEMIRCIYLI